MSTATTQSATCAVCEGTGWKRVERSGLSGVVRCECAAASRAQSIKETANIPANYVSATFDTFRIPQDNPAARSALASAKMEVRKWVREFPEDDRPGLLLIGEPGSGKTHLAISAMKDLLDRGFECLFWDYQNLLERIQSSFNAASGSADREAYRSALDAEVLLLDDLGAHRVSEWVEDTVTSIITHRCNHRKPLIATTNLPDPDATGQQVESVTPGGITLYKKTLADSIGPRARSRLFEMCRTVKILDVEDYRVKRGR